MSCKINAQNCFFKYLYFKILLKKNMESAIFFLNWVFNRLHDPLLGHDPLVDKHWLRRPLPATYTKLLTLSPRERPSALNTLRRKLTCIRSLVLSYMAIGDLHCKCKIFPLLPIAIIGFFLFCFVLHDFIPDSPDTLYTASLVPLGILWSILDFSGRFPVLHTEHNISILTFLCLPCDAMGSQ